MKSGSEVHWISDSMISRDTLLYGPSYSGVCSREIPSAAIACSLINEDSQVFCRLSSRQ